MTRLTVPLLGSVLFALTSALTPAFAFGTDGTALIMGGTDNPEPDPAYVMDVDTNYIQYLYPGYTAQGLYTPEELWPITGITDLTYGKSVAEGVRLLNDAIMAQPSGSDIAVAGYSESAAIATIEMRKLAAADFSSGNLHFVLLADPNNPDGGILERFCGLYLPILNVAFNGATPPYTPFPTDIYTIQYDPIGDFPQYPLNLVSDLNALLGHYYLHSDYPTVPAPDYTVTLPTSQWYHGVTHYYEMLTQNLPLLDPLRQIPFVGNPLAELLQPDLRVIVDLGYGDGYANIPTTAGLFPLVNPFTVAGDLVTGAYQGIVAALADVGLLPASDLPTSYPYLPMAETPGEIPNLWSGLGFPSEALLSGNDALLSGSDLLPSLLGALGLDPLLSALGLLG